MTSWDFMSDENAIVKMNELLASREGLFDYYGDYHKNVFNQNSKKSEDAWGENLRSTYKYLNNPKPPSHEKADAYALYDIFKLIVCFHLPIVEKSRNKCAVLQECLIPLRNVSRQVLSPDEKEYLDTLNYELKSENEYFENNIQSMYQNGSHCVYDIKTFYEEALAEAMGSSMLAYAKTYFENEKKTEEQYGFFLPVYRFFQFLRQVFSQLYDSDMGKKTLFELDESRVIEKLKAYIDSHKDNSQNNLLASLNDPENRKGLVKYMTLHASSIMNEACKKVESSDSDLVVTQFTSNLSENIRENLGLLPTWQARYSNIKYPEPPKSIGPASGLLPLSQARNNNLEDSVEEPVVAPVEDFTELLSDFAWAKSFLDDKGQYLPPDKTRNYIAVLSAPQKKPLKNLPCEGRVSGFQKKFHPFGIKTKSSQKNRHPHPRLTQ